MNYALLRVLQVGFRAELAIGGCVTGLRWGECLKIMSLCEMRARRNRYRPSGRYELTDRYRSNDPDD